MYVISASECESHACNSQSFASEPAMRIQGLLRRTIMAEVKRAKFYLVIADEVTDMANKEELSLSLCFVNDGSVKEVFVDFVEVERKTGQVLA